MATAIRSITNLTPHTLTLKVPSLEQNLAPVTIGPSVTLDLLTVITEDELLAMQLYLQGMVDRGNLSVAAILDLSTFTFDGVLSLRANSNPHISGDVQLSAGSNVSLSQTGSSITINSTGGGGGGSPGGSSGDIQYNSSGSFGGASITTDGNNLSLLADTPLFLGTEKIIFISAIGGGISIADDNTSTARCTINAAGDMVLEANTLVDGTGTFYPEIFIGSPNVGGYSIEIDLGPQVNLGNLYIHPSDLSFTRQSSALLELDAITQGFLPPRMTTTQKNAIVSPAAGLVVYDTTAHALYFYNGTTWIIASGGGSGTPGGSTTDIQFNNSGSFAGSADLTWDDTNKILSLDGSNTSPNTEILFGNLSNNGTSYLASSERLIFNNPVLEGYGLMLVDIQQGNSVAVNNPAGTLSTAGTFFLYSNLNLDGSGNYSPWMEIGESGLNVGVFTGNDSSGGHGTLYVVDDFVGGSPNASAILQAISTNQGFLPPVMTTTQKNAIATPAEGLMVYDSTLHAPYYWNGSTWIAF